MSITSLALAACHVPSPEQSTLEVRVATEDRVEGTFVSPSLALDVTSARSDGGVRTSVHAGGRLIVELVHAEPPVLRIDGRDLLALEPDAAREALRVFAQEPRGQAVIEFAAQLNDELTASYPQALGTAGAFGSFGKTLQDAADPHGTVEQEVITGDGWTCRGENMTCNAVREISAPRCYSCCWKLYGFANLGGQLVCETLCYSCAGG